MLFGPEKLALMLLEATNITLPFPYMKCEVNEPRKEACPAHVLSKDNETKISYS